MRKDNKLEHQGEKETDLFSSEMVTQGLSSLQQKKAYHPYLTYGKKGQEILTTINNGPLFKQFKEDEHNIIARIADKLISLTTVSFLPEILLPKRPYSCLYDIGTGDGITLEYLLKRLESNGIKIRDGIKMIDTNKEALGEASKRISNTIKTVKELNMNFIDDDFVDSRGKNNNRRTLFVSTGCTLGNLSLNDLRILRGYLYGFYGKDAYWIQTFFTLPNDDTSIESYKNFVLGAYGAYQGGEGSDQQIEYENHKEQVLHYLKNLGYTGEDLDKIEYTVKESTDKDGNRIIEPGFYATTTIGQQEKKLEAGFYPIFISKRFKIENIEKTNDRLSHEKDFIKGEVQGKYVSGFVVGLEKKKENEELLKTYGLYKIILLVYFLNQLGVFNITNLTKIFMGEDYKGIFHKNEVIDTSTTPKDTSSIYHHK